MESKDYYATLGVAKDAPKDDIKRAYRKLARRFHPDVSSEPDAEARFKEVNEAWEVLGDDEKRAAYDDFRSGRRSRAEGFAGGQTGPGFSGADTADFSDFFRDLFGGGGFERPGGAGTTSGFRGFASRGEDLHVRLPLTLEEAYAGSEQSLSVAIPEADAQGRIARRQRTLKVKIPAGVTDGQQIRLKGQGGPGGGGGPAGDLFVEIQLVPHPRYAVDGRNLTTRVPLSPSEAALGARLEVPTLGGRVNVKVPPGTSSGHRLRLKGRGLPGKPPGDQYLEFQIMVPKTLTPREQELYEALDEASSFDPREAREARS